MPTHKLCESTWGFEAWLQNRRLCQQTLKNQLWISFRSSRRPTLPSATVKGVKNFRFIEERLENVFKSPTQKNKKSKSTADEALTIVFDSLEKVESAFRPLVKRLITYHWAIVDHFSVMRKLLVWCPKNTSTVKKVCSSSLPLARDSDRPTGYYFGPKLNDSIEVNVLEDKDETFQKNCIRQRAESALKESFPKNVEQIEIFSKSNRRRSKYEKWSQTWCAWIQDNERVDYEGSDLPARKEKRWWTVVKRVGKPKNKKEQQMDERALEGWKDTTRLPKRQTLKLGKPSWSTGGCLTKHVLVQAARKKHTHTTVVAGQNVLKVKCDFGHFESSAQMNENNVKNKCGKRKRIIRA